MCSAVDGDEPSVDENGEEGGPDAGSTPLYMEQGGTADVYDTLQDGFAMAMSNQKHPREFHGLLSVLDGECAHAMPVPAPRYPP